MTGEKVPTKKKIPKFQDIKKPIIIGGIIGVVALAGIISGIVYYLNIQQPEPVVLVFGVASKPENIDPLATDGGIDIDIINQVAEGLFEIDVKTLDEKRSSLD